MIIYGCTETPMLVNSDNVFTFDVAHMCGDSFSIRAYHSGEDFVTLGFYTKLAARIALNELYGALERGAKAFEMPDQQELEMEYGELLGDDE